MPFTLHRDHFVSQRDYGELSPATATRAGPAVYPDKFPHDLTRRPDLAGEAAVYKAIAGALPTGTQVFYNRSVQGAKRYIDFLVLIPQRGLIAIEVKGGLVHVGHGAFRQETHSVQGQRSHRKRIEPFRQVKLALDQLWQKSGIGPLAIPTFIMAAFPKMSEAAYPWGPATHILTREDFDEPQRLRRRIVDALPHLARPLPALELLSVALINRVPRTPKKP